MRQALHIHSGDAAADTARQLLAGQHLSWYDLLMYGPLPAGHGDDSWYAARAEALQPFAGSAAGAERQLRQKDEELSAAIADASEITLWFDACLYDQLLLCALLARCAPLRAAWSRAYLLCENSAPGHPCLLGYGELTAAELPPLLTRRVRLTPAHLTAADAAWRVFTAPTPEPWLALARSDMPLLPFVPAAAQRLLEQLPCVSSGLDRLERQILSSVLDGTSQPLALFEQVSAQEPMPYFGDSVLWHSLNGLCDGATPLLRLSGPAARLPVAVPCAGEPAHAPLTAWSVLGTLQGMRSLWGWGDWRALQPVKRHVANVLLNGPGGWRWDRWQQELVQLPETAPPPQRSSMGGATE
jgi:hypothetical protein